MYLILLKGHYLEVVAEVELEQLQMVLMKFYMDLEELEVELLLKLIENKYLVIMLLVLLEMKELVELMEILGIMEMILHSVIIQII